MKNKPTPSDKEKKEYCPICALGGTWAIGCVGDIFITPYPKMEVEDDE